MTNYLHGIEIIEVDVGGRTITIPSTSIIGIVGTAPACNEANFPLNTPVVISNIQDIKKLELGDFGTIPQALYSIYNQTSTICIVVRINDGETQADTIVNAGGDMASYSGVYALLRAEAETSYKPKLICCPYLNSILTEDDKPNAINNNLGYVADKLRAVAILDGTNTTSAEVMEFANNLTINRGYLVDPSYKPSFTLEDPNTTTVSASALVAGIIAATDAKYGFWYSPSNKEAKGVLGTSRPIDFNITDYTCEANLLNEKAVATLVFSQGKYKLWGNKCTNADPRWQFLSVRRTMDIVYDALERNLMWANDLPFNKNLINDIQANMQTFISSLKAKGASLGGQIWVDILENTKEELEAGHLTISFDMEPPSPLERMTIKAYRNNGYYEEMIS